MKKILLVVYSALLFASCSEETNTEDTSSKTTEPTPVAITAPVFDAEQAYQHIAKQVSFGPRVPGTKAQQQCADYLIDELKKITDTVYVQKTTVTQPVSNKSYPCINIVGSINPAATNRVLILAHWDSRAWADEDVVNKNQPIDAADDGASGIGVMLELAKQMKAAPPKDLGVDFLMVDVEDMGKTEWTDASYCLGTQHWARNPHVPGYRAQYGICLDMVGAKGANFPLEAYSKQHAGDIQQRIWQTASTLGYSSYFPYRDAGLITDDHVPVNEIIKIPCVDIIHLKHPYGFGDHWHTHNDNLQIIDKAVLKAVGQTVMQVVYESQ